MLRYPRLFALAAAALLPLPSVFQTTLADNLLDIYRSALDNDPTFKAAQATFLAATQKNPQARAALLPSLSAAAARLRNRDEIIAPNVAFIREGEAEFASEEYSLTLTQPVYNYPDFAKLKQAKIEVKQAEVEFAAEKQALILRAARTYLDVLAAQDNLELATTEEAALASQLELATARLEVGLGTIIDLHDALARYKLAGARKIEATNRLEDAYEALAELIGRPPPPLASLGKEVPLARPEPPEVEAWVELALQGNLTLKARRHTVQAAHQEVKIQRGGHLPSLDIVATRRRTDAQGSIGGSGLIRDSTDVGLALTVPLLQGGLVVAKTKEAKYQFDAAREEFERQRRATVRVVRAAFLGVTGKASMIDALQQAVTAGESALEGKREGFEAGIGTNLDVLNAQRDLYRAKRDFSRARYDYLLNLLRLKQAVGALNEDTLTQINGWLG